MLREQVAVGPGFTASSSVYLIPVCHGSSYKFPNNTGPSPAAILTTMAPFVPHSCFDHSVRHQNPRKPAEEYVIQRKDFFLTLQVDKMTQNQAF